MAIISYRTHQTRLSLIDLVMITVGLAFSVMGVIASLVNGTLLDHLRAPV